MNRIFNRVVRSHKSIALGLCLATTLAVQAAEPTIRTFTQITQTTASSQSSTVNEFVVRVTSASGDAPTGSVILLDGAKQLSAVAVEDGIAKFKVDFTAGEHNVVAKYVGDDEHIASQSTTSGFHTENSTTPTYTLSANPVTWASVTPGNSVTSTITITPANNASTTSPTFFTISCSGLPADSSCYFTPATIELPAGSNSPITSTMTLQTQATSGSLQQPGFSKQGGTLALAILLPGVLALGVFGRKRSATIRLMMLGLVAFVASFAFSGCSALYSYYNHGPPNNKATPAGTYTITVEAQTSNGVTATILTPVNLTLIVK